MAWPGPPPAGMQPHSGIPAAAQTQWHFIKSWATPSPLSVCWRCPGNQIPSLGASPLHAPLLSAPSPTPLLWASSDPSLVAKGRRGCRTRIKTPSPSGPQEPGLFGRSGGLTSGLPWCGHNSPVGVVGSSNCTGFEGLPENATR